MQGDFPELKRMRVYRLKMSSKCPEQQMKIELYAWYLQNIREKNYVLQTLRDRERGEKSENRADRLQRIMKRMILELSK